MNELAESIAALIGGRKPGFSLPQAFYVRDDVFAADMRLLQGRWTFIGLESEAPEPGDWITAGFAQESAIVVRGDDGALRAMANVCRHRGSRICDEARGHSVFLTCPYHAWTYRLDGSLRAAREMDEVFETGVFGLKRLPIEIVGGLVFVSFGESPPSLRDAAPALAAMTSVYGWDSARVAARRSYTVAANWKLALENYHECYHCGPAHPEFSVLHQLARPQVRRLRSAEESLADRSGGVAVADFEAWGDRDDGREVVRVMRSDLAAGVRTGSQDGALMARLMGPDDGACVFAELGYLSAFLAYADHGVAYRFIPRGVLATEMEVLWLVDGGAEPGRDYDPDALTWLWDVTSRADKRIIERNQQGVRSRFYEPGPFSRMEPGAGQFADRYLADLAAAALS